MTAVSLYAELEIFHTRPAVPTRRLALGHLVLPVDPAPGVGGLLLGAVVARFLGGVDVELRFDLTCLLDEVQAGSRVVQPRLRHRYQTDRHGLAHSRHTISGTADAVEMEFDSHGSDLAQVLGAIYAIERIHADARPAVGTVVRRAMRWNGPIGPAMIAYLAGSEASSLSVLADPRGWAMALLGLHADREPSAKDVTQAYRAKMREAHPDLGGEADLAAGAINDLNEARRILSGG